MRACELFGDWANVLVWRKVRRIDIILVLAGLICTGYYGLMGGWWNALYGGLTYIFILMVALWLL